MSVTIENMKDNREANVSYWAHHLTTIVSVTLVLLLVGIIAMIWIGASHETRRLKERIEMSVVMADTVSPARTLALAEELRGSGYARNVTVVSKEEALKAWKEDTGEDLEEIFGVNPLSEEISFGLAADFASASKMNEIKDQLASLPGVEAVSTPDAGMIDAMNDNIERLTFILAVVAIVMLVISFVLINNTVHLTIYSRRFSIHTMQLVGATNGFIRRPFVLENMTAGLLAGVVAAAMLALGMTAARNGTLPDIADYISWDAYAVVAASIIVTGVLLCGLASSVSATVYLKKDYDDLFK